MKRFVFRVMVALGGIALMLGANGAVWAFCTSTGSASAQTIQLPSTIFSNLPANINIPVGGWREVDEDVFKDCPSGALDLLAGGQNNAVFLVTTAGHDGVQRTYYAQPVDNTDNFTNPYLLLIAEIAGDGTGSNNTSAIYNYANNPVTVQVPSTGAKAGIATLHIYYEFVTSTRGTPATGTMDVPQQYVGNHPVNNTWVIGDFDTNFTRSDDFLIQPSRTYTFQAPTCTVLDTTVNLGNLSPGDLAKYDSSYLSSTYHWKRIQFNIQPPCNVNGMLMTFTDNSTVGADGGFPVTMGNGSDSSNLEVMLRRKLSNNIPLDPPELIQNAFAVPGAGAIYFSCDASGVQANQQNCTNSDLAANADAVDAALFTTDGSAVQASGQGSAEIHVTVDYR